MATVYGAVAEMVWPKTGEAFDPPLGHVSCIVGAGGRSDAEVVVGAAVVAGAALIATGAALVRGAAELVRGAALLVLAAAPVAEASLVGVGVAVTAMPTMNA